MERAVLKVFFFFSASPPPDTFPSTAPSSDVSREQHNSHKGGTREKYNSYKQKTIGTKCQLTISRQTSCNDYQTLTLHHARIPITSKRGRRFYETRENSNFWKNGKIVISDKTRNFSRFQMMKRISPLVLSREI